MTKSPFIMISKIHDDLAQQGYTVPKLALIEAIGKNIVIHDTQISPTSAPVIIDIAEASTPASPSDWLISDTVKDKDIKVRVGNTSSPATVNTNLTSVLSSLENNPALQHIAQQARYNIRRYGHATISHPGVSTETTFAELTDLPQNWSSEPEKYNRSSIPFAQLNEDGSDPLKRQKIKQPPIVIFTDGSSIMRHNKPHEAGWCWAGWINFDPEKEREPDEENSGGRYGSTNNQMEIIAMAQALENFVDYPGDIEIHADSELAIKWALKTYKYKKSATESEENFNIRKDAIESAIYSLAARKNAGLNTQIKHTPAHTGFWPNEYVDTKAKAAGKKTRAA